MEQMENFRRNADRLGLCEEFSKRWDSCGSKLQLYKLACDINSLPYLCESICKGWGLTEDYIATEFAPFVNGKCGYRGDGYSSCIWCNPHTDTINIKTTATLIIGYRGRVVIPHICELYLCNSEVMIEGKGTAICYLYNSDIVKVVDSDIRFKEIKRY